MWCAARFGTIFESLQRISNVRHNSEMKKRESKHQTEKSK